MLEYVKGQLIDLSENVAILDVNGLGYRILIPIHLHKKLPCKKSECFFYVSLVIREDAHTLYGFQEQKERDLFETLLHVSGIGPKTALNLIGHLPLNLFFQAVNTNHIATLTKVPGIGKKTAERLLLELRGKVELTGSIEVSSCQRVSDALHALLQLGLSPTYARSALDQAIKANPESETSDLIAFALKNKKAL